MSLIKEVMQTFSGSTATIKPIWSFDIKAPILAPPLTYSQGKEHHIIVATKDGRVVHLNGEGKPEWEFSINNKLSKVDLMFMDEQSAKSISGMPALLISAEPLIIFGSEAGIIHAITLSGKKAWEIKTKGAIRSSPLIADINGDGIPEIIITSMDKIVYVISPQGKIIWTFLADAEIESSPSFAKIETGSSIFFGTNAGTLYCLSSEGKERWSFKIKAPITTQPACGKITGTNEVYIAFGAHDNHVYVISERGIKEWSFETQGKILAPICLADINTDNRLEVCVGSTDDSVYMLSSNGGKIWQFETDFWVASPMLITDFNNDGKMEIAAGSYDKSLYILAGEGEYQLQSMPGAGNLTQDFSNPTGLISTSPGTTTGKAIAKHKASGMITGISRLTPTTLIITTANGKIEAMNI